MTSIQSIQVRSKGTNFGPAMDVTLFHVQYLERMMEQELHGKTFSPGEDGPLRALERVRSALRDLQVARIKLASIGRSNACS